MKIVILNEGDSDSRVSASPETVRKIYEMNHSIYVQKGAGVESNFIDQEYEENGAKIFEDKDTIREADIIFKINKPSIDEIELFKENSILIAALDPFNNPELIENLKNKKIISFAMDCWTAKYPSWHSLLGIYCWLRFFSKFCGIVPRT